MCIWPTNPKSKFHYTKSVYNNKWIVSHRNQLDVFDEHFYTAPIYPISFKYVMGLKLVGLSNTVVLFKLRGAQAKNLELLGFPMDPSPP
jgi:hypothetical protein